jgi:hypothetical protein
MDADTQTLDSKTGKPPETRIKDVASLNAVVKKMIESDQGSAMNRVDVQKMLDGTPPFSDDYLRQTGQDGRCNLNFGDGKMRVKLEAAGYYDLTESVPTLAFVQTDFGEPTERQNWNGIMSEEFHRTLKDWKQFDANFQLLVQKFISHGVGFLYFRDDVDWRWDVAGLDDFKVPRSTTLSEDDCDIAVVLRNVTVSKLYSWIKDVDEKDSRWSIDEVQKAIMNASDQKDINNSWEKFQEVIKNNDLFVSTTAQQTVAIAHAWVREFTGKISHYITLQNGGNTDYLFKAENRFDNVNECFNFFPYEVGSNGTLHGTRGLAHEIYGAIQVINSLKCQSVDNAKLSGSLLLQPATEMDAEDMAILFYAGAAYLPPNLKVQNANLANPSNNILPVLDEMSLSLRHTSGDVSTNARDASQREKTKFEVQGDMTKESVIPTANMNLFYQPWGRHLNEVWRRFTSKGVRAKDPGGKEIHEFRKRCIERGVPEEAIFGAKRVTPVRAVGYGSPTARLMALDEFMQYYGSLDPVGQNNLLRDRFAQRVGYSQVDRYVPKIDVGGRMPVDLEIAELQNAMMSAGQQASVRPNDQHLMHLSVHFPDIENDLLKMEEGQGDEQIFNGVKVKIEHIGLHMERLKPDKLNEDQVAEFTRVYNNVSQRVVAAQKALDVQMAKQAQQQPQGPQISPQMQMKLADHQLEMHMRQEAHQLEMRLMEESATQKRTLADAGSAARLRAEANRARVLQGAPAFPAAPAPIPMPAPAVPVAEPAPAPAPAPAPVA